MADFRGKGEQVRELCRKLKPLLGPKVEQLYQAYLAEDQAGKEQIEAYLELLAAKHLPSTVDKEQPALVPPPRELASGDYPVGQILYAGKPLYPFSLREDEWIQHVGIFGRSGAGKTHLGFLLLRELLRKGKPVLVFDWKRNYRDLLSLPEFKGLEVYTIGRGISPLTFNPLIPPPGTQPKTWLKKLNEVIAHAYMLGNGVLYLLQQTLDELYEETGVYSGQVTRWPTFQDLLTKARQLNLRGREAGWLSSTLRALASLCFGDMGDLVNQRQANSPEALLNKAVILELDALTQQDKVFFASALLLWIHHRRMAEGQRETFRGSVLIEEAHHVLSDERRSLVGGQSVMEIAFREIREFGVGIVCLDQHPSQISLPALGNTYTTICLNLKHSKDVNVMGQCMLLSDEERDLLGSLEVGQAVVKLQGRIPQAFVIQIPDFEVHKGEVTDEDVRRRMEPVLSSRLPQVSQELREAQPFGQPPAEALLPGLELQFLKDVDTYPDIGIAARYKRLGISVRQGQKIKAYLAADGFIQEEETRTQTGKLLRIRLTEKGRQYLNQEQKAAPEPQETASEAQE
jgi:hypothetical protein